MKGLPVVEWLRSKLFSSRNASLIWRGFLQVIPWLGMHLAWQVGNGESILLGIDPIVGSHTPYTLPEELRTYLEDLNLCTLSQAHNSLPNAKYYWFSV